MTDMNGSRKSPTPGGGNNNNNDVKRSASSSASPDNTPSASGGRLAMQVSSDEINVLVYRYLQEAGTSNMKHLLGYI